jgi:serine/threonine-protein kinase
VFAARHLELDQMVAIKVLYEDLAARSTAAERFRRAARAAARMQGPHVCRVLDIGAQPDGSPFMVMEYLEGCHLGRELERRGLLTQQEAFECILQACDAVAEAHAAGIVHRDLKPANLFWAALPDGSRHIKVLGFGVSKSLSRSNPGDLTISSGSSSAPAYLAPEQLDAGHEIDERTDIWTLAVVFYELLSGRPPFQGESIPALVSSVLNGRVKPLSELQLGTPPGLDAVIAKALAKRPDERYASIPEFVSALLPFAPQLEASGSDVPATQFARSLSQSRHRAIATTAAASQVGLPPSPRPVTPHASLGTTHAPARYGTWLLLALLCAGAAAALFTWTHSEPATAAVSGETAINGSQGQPSDNVVRPAASAPAARATEVAPQQPSKSDELPSGISPASTEPLAKPPPPPPEKPAAAAAGALKPTPSEKPEPARSATDPFELPDFGGRR